MDNKNGSLKSKYRNKRKYPSENYKDNEFNTHKRFKLSSTSSVNSIKSAKLDTSITVKSRPFKTSVNSAKPTSTTRLKKNEGKLPFKEGCLSNQMNNNLKKVVSKKKSLQDQLKEVEKRTDEKKVKLLDEHIKMNLNLIELEELKKTLHEYKENNVKKKATMVENSAKITGIKESAQINLDKTKILIDELNNKKYNLKSKIQIKEQDINEEEAKVNFD